MTMMDWCWCLTFGNKYFAFLSLFKIYRRGHKRAISKHCTHYGPLCWILGTFTTILRISMKVQDKHNFYINLNSGKFHTVGIVQNSNRKIVEMVSCWHLDPRHHRNIRDKMFWLLLFIMDILIWVLIEYPQGFQYFSSVAVFYYLLAVFKILEFEFQEYL